MAVIFMNTENQRWRTITEAEECAPMPSGASTVMVTASDRADGSTALAFADAHLEGQGHSQSKSQCSPLGLLAKLQHKKKRH